MKRLLILISLLLWATVCSAETQLAWMNQAIAGSGGSAASCGNLMTPRTDGVSNTPISQDTNNELYMASSFQATATGSVKTVYINIKDGGTPSSLPANLLMYLCAGNGTNPNGIGTCTQSTTTNITDPGGTYVQKKYKFTGFDVTSGNEYWLILTSSYGSNNATNTFIVQSNGTVTGDHIYDSPDGTTWSSWDTSAQINMTITSCDE